MEQDARRNFGAAWNELRERLLIGTRAARVLATICGQEPEMSVHTVSASERSIGRLLAYLGGGLFFSLIILQSLAT
jgi:hypothetical protein